MAALKARPTRESAPYRTAAGSDPGQKGEPMRLLGIIVVLGRRIVKAAETRAWYRLERAAVWVLAHSHRHIAPGYRLRRVHSDALHKGNVVPIVPQVQRCGWLN